MLQIALTLLLWISFSHAESDIHITTIPGKSPKVMILAHGMGANYKIYESVKVDQTLVSFNFPDHDCFERQIPFERTTFGTFDELIPLLHVLHQQVIQENRTEIDLYGFSAGGGAIVNVLAVLNTHRFDIQLNALGIAQADKIKMLKAVEKGIIILDVPLKSMQELIDIRGANRDLLLVQKRYQENDMEPIEALKYLKELNLHVIIHFQNPDEALFNRDDQLYFERFKAVNPHGTTDLVIGNDGGHNAWHRSLWEFYHNLLTSRAPVSSVDL